MKKRLLITSIVMMLVVAVALSTATYAWFTSNTQVTATQISFTANTSDSESIAIAWTGNSNPGTTLSAGTNGTAMDPMIPSSVEVGTTSTAFLASFTTGTLFSDDGVATFNDADSHAADPVVWSTSDNGAEPAATATSFYIKNMSPANAVTNITVKATITGDHAELVRIAVFTKD